MHYDTGIGDNKIGMSACSGVGEVLFFNMFSKLFVRSRCKSVMRRDTHINSYDVPCLRSLIAFHIPRQQKQKIRSYSHLIFFKTAEFDYYAG